MENNKWEPLEELRRGVNVILTDKFCKVLCDVERDTSLRSKIITMTASALGQTIDTITFPVDWERMIKRKDCPKYLKHLVDIKVDVYYPKIKLPEEKHWITFEKPMEHTE